MSEITKADDLVALARLGLWLLEEHREHMADINGGDVQDKAEQFGVIVPVTVIDACSDDCVCAEFDFPMQCYRDTETTKRARAWLKAAP